MKRLLKISSITGSAVAPIASRRAAAFTRRSTTWFLAVISARQPSSTTMVWCGSMISAGPSTAAPSGSRLDVDGLNHDRLRRVDEAEPRLVRALERAPHRFRVGEIDFQRGVGTAV